MFRSLLRNINLKIITNIHKSKELLSFSNNPVSILFVLSFLSLPCFLCALISLKMGCKLWAPFPPHLGSLWARVHYQPASSRKRKVPTEPAISTLFYWSGPLYWFRSGSTSGSYNCCLSLWLVTHTPCPRASFQMYCTQTNVAVDTLVWVLKKLVVHFGLKSFAERTLTSWWAVLEKLGREREEALLPGPIKGLAQFLLRIDTKVMVFDRSLGARLLIHHFLRTSVQSRRTSCNCNLPQKQK